MLTCRNNLVSLQYVILPQLKSHPPIFCFFPFSNLQAVLETIRNLMNTDCVVPDWLHDIILGYGDPSSAHYSKMPNQIASLDFNDTFLSIDHLKASFPGYNIKVTVDNPDLQVPPFRWSQNFKYSSSGILSALSRAVEFRGWSQVLFLLRICVHMLVSRLNCIIEVAVYYS